MVLALTVVLPFIAINDHAIEYALGWAIAVGSPYVFLNTMEMEYRSDIYGERIY